MSQKGVNIKPNEAEIVSKCDVCMKCMHEITILLPTPGEFIRKANNDLHKIINLISVMKGTGLYNKAPYLDKLHENINEVLRLINQIEAGNLMIQGDKAIQNAYDHIMSL